MIYNAKIEEIKSWEFENGWYCSPSGDWVTLGNGVTLGDRITLGDWVTLGNDVTSADLNNIFRKKYIQQNESHIFSKWVTHERRSPNFDGGSILDYPIGSIIEIPEAQISDKQCDIGLHVFRYGYRPEWDGLCEANHNYIEIHVEVMSEDICFAGLPGNDAKLRVKKLKVLD